MMQGRGGWQQQVVGVFSGLLGQRWGRVIGLLAVVLVGGWLGLFPTTESGAPGTQADPAASAAHQGQATRRDGASSAPATATDPAASSAATSPPAAPAGSSARSASTGASSVSGLPEIRVQDLPPEARDTLALIRQGGPYPYEKDGTIFGNREGVLPRQRRGYYTEYTVQTPRVRHRGARRIVAGGQAGQYTEFYYTDDHYQSFRRVRMP